MVAGIDIGNSTVSFCFFEQTTNQYQKNTYPLQEFTDNILHKELQQVKHCIISSVVQPLAEQTAAFCEKNRISYTTVSLKTPTIVDFSRYQSNLGSDRICTSVGAAFHYPLPVCVVDMGTATTISLIDQNRIYQGGLIFPGISTLFKSLHLLTNQLPDLNLQMKPETLLAFSTHDNIKSGVYHLARFGIHGILQELKNQHPRLTVVATGGWSYFFKEIYDFQDAHLIFKGLQNIFYHQIKGSVL